MAQKADGTVYIDTLLKTTGFEAGGKEIEAGSFYTVTEAYGLGLLTREHVMSIAYYHNGGTRCNEDIMGTNYVPLPKTPYTPSKKMDAAIKESFYNSDYCGSYREGHTKEDVCYGYFGTYGNAVAVKMGFYGEGVSLAVFEEEVDGITIYSTVYKRVLIWVSNLSEQDKTDEVEAGAFYTVTEAYELGLLTREHVMSIAYYRNGGTRFNEEIMGKDYVPLPKTPEKLSEKTENAIKQSHLDRYYQGKDYAELSGVRIDKYYGTYNGSVAVIVSDDYSGTTGDEWIGKVDGISIIHSGRDIDIWIGHI